MARAIDSIYSIINNPFKLMELIIKFYFHCENRDNDILLAYLILPLTLNEDSRKKLKNLNKNSDLFSLVKDTNSIIGLELMIEEYKDITNKCIQLAISNGYLELRDNRSLVKTDKILQNNFFISNEMNRAIEKFAMIIKSIDIVSIYRILGVKKI
ncbi:three component ABC system middle component [Clostridium drakei]|uniref:Uncharacterized protein n=1 Tax=Clostridium drakei TaxID=332101 RepID=A0A2U8DVQ2_9CLOT|nr:three component ABC system middle component [Clostridium drakei]AWI06758.1 hypothetical protein B9W14_20405 [Clostridium drakei]